MTNNADLVALIRTIPDYPKTGTLLRDVSTQLLDGSGYCKTSDWMAALVMPGIELIAGIEGRRFIVDLPEPGGAEKLCYRRAFAAQN